MCIFAAPSSVAKERKVDMVYSVNCEPLETHFKVHTHTQKRANEVNEKKRKKKKKYCHKIIFRKKRNFSFSISFFVRSITCEYAGEYVMSPSDSNNRMNAVRIRSVLSSM